jgi:hypothetical protein
MGIAGAAAASASAFTAVRRDPSLAVEREFGARTAVSAKPSTAHHSRHVRDYVTTIFARIWTEKRKRL